MTTDDIKGRVAQIKAVAGDAEIAHGLEDSLWRDVLKAIADQHPDPDRLAREALRTRAIDFVRHCA